jgi:hypothetical protein
MIAFGVFWMFVWLIGTNGYSESKGTTILGLNLLLVILFVVVSGAVTGYLSERLQKKTGLSFFIAAPLTILMVVAAAGAALFVGSIIIVIIFGQTR